MTQKITQFGKIRNRARELLWPYKMPTTPILSCLNVKSMTYT
jgi:hypothetical protein